MKQKIPLEKATEEIDGWLDRKKIYPSAREECSDQIDTLVEAISLGDLSLNDKGEFKHELLFPLKEEQALTQLEYKARLNDRMLEPYLKGIKAGDGVARIVAYLACLTSQAKGIIKALDTADRKITNAIVIFFIS
ncbi:hypothetical protein LCGC14_2196930 [marine sediment metagenome]|uniref:Uncharacterized protein n=1 Tax=marine sediment metagenome TaxID=412755 RepID=A0A0F9DI29_9ZZZZ